MTQAATKPSSQTGARLLVQSLEAQGVEYVFGIPGAKIDKVFDTLVDSKSRRSSAGTNKTPPSSPAVSDA